MMIRYRYILYLALILSLTEISRSEITENWSVTTLNNPAPGYLHFDWEAPFFLLDNYGHVQYPDSLLPPNLRYFHKLDNDNWLAISPDILYVLGPQLNIIDSMFCPSGLSFDFHDFNKLHNGNYMILCTEIRVTDMSKIVSGGKTDAQLVGSVLLELNPSGATQWIWKSLDHYTITEVTPDIQLTQQVIDLTHINSFCEDVDGNIIISVRHYDEVSKINKSDGEFLWRMGGSYCRNNQFTFYNDNANSFVGFSHQHCVRLLENGNLIMFDNGNMKTPQYSRAVEYQIDPANKTARNVWEYRYSPDIFQYNMGNATRLSNGNTLINWGKNKITEVTPDKNIAYELTFNTGLTIYRAGKYVTRMGAATNFINSAGNYSFNQTGMAINVTGTGNTGIVSVEKHNYPVPNPVFADTTFSSLYSCRWVISSTQTIINQGTIKILANSIAGMNNPDKTAVYYRNKESQGTFTEIPQTYNTSTGEINFPFAGTGEYFLGVKKLSPVTLALPSDNVIGVKTSGKLIWKKTLSATKYKVQLSQNPNFSSFFLNQFVNTDTSIAYTGLEYSTSYYWRVLAINSIDTSNWSPTRTFTTLLSGPSLSYPQDKTFGISLTDTLRWSNVTGSNNYWIQVSADTNFTNILINSSNLAKTEFNLTSNLGNNKKVFWRVRAYRSTDTSDWSAIRSFNTVMESPKQLSPPDETINMKINGLLSWKAVDGAVSYTIELAEDMAFSVNKMQFIGVAGTNYQFISLAYDKQYYWHIQANRSTDNSGWSAVNKFTTIFSPPVQLSPQKGETNLEPAIKLNWQKVKSTDSYRIQLSLYDNFGYTLIDTLTKDTNSISVEVLPASTKIFWRVMGFNNKTGQMSEWSDIWNFRTGPGAPIQAPALLFPDNGSVQENSLAFQWSKSLKATCYRIQICADSAMSQTVKDTYITGLTINISNLLFDKNYYWRVKAIGQTDSSKWSDRWTFKTVKTAIVKLITPENDYKLQTDTVLLTWSSITKAEKYNLQIASDENFKQLISDNSDISQTQFILKNLVPRQNYYWRLRYTSSGEYSDWSLVRSFSYPGKIELSSPVLIYPADGSVGIDINGLCDWSPDKKATNYDISMYKTSTFDNVVFRYSGLVDTVAHYTNLDYNQKYYWRVSSANSTSSSNWSKAYGFTTELQEPEILYPDDDVSDVPYDASIQWYPHNEARYFVVNISQFSDFSSLVVADTIEDNVMYQFKLQPEQLYFMRLKALSSTNFSKWTQTRKFRTGLTSGIADAVHQINIYPNPASDVIYLSGSFNASYTYSIIDLQGVMLDKGQSIGKIDVSKLSAGCYYLKLDTQLIKFIKL